MDNTAKKGTCHDRLFLCFLRLFSKTNLFDSIFKILFLKKNTRLYAICLFGIIVKFEKVIECLAVFVSFVAYAAAIMNLSCYVRPCTCDMTECMHTACTAPNTKRNLISSLQL